MAVRRMIRRQPRHAFEQRQADDPPDIGRLRRGQTLGRVGGRHAGDDRMLAVDERTVAIEYDQTKAGGWRHGHESWSFLSGMQQVLGKPRKIM